MKKAHKVFAELVIGLFLGTWILGALAGWLAFSFSGLEQILWNGSMTLIAFATIIASTHFIQPDGIIVAVFLGEVYGVYAPETPANKGEVSSKGIFGTDIVFIFPFPLAKAYRFPLTAFTLPINDVLANTRKTDQEPLTPVKAYLSMTIRVCPNVHTLQKLIQTIPAILRSNQNLMGPDEEMEFLSEVSPEGEIVLKPKRCSILALRIENALRTTIHERVSRAIAHFSLSECLENSETLKNKIKEQMRGTIVEQAGLINEVSEGIVPFFDINISKIIPIDKETAKFLSAETSALLKSRGHVAEARGLAEATVLEGEALAQYIEAVANQLKTPEGKLAFARELTKSLPEGTQLIITPGMIDAAIAKILKAQNHS